MAQLGQSPDKPYDGSQVPQTSIPGKNVNFVQPSNMAGASLTLAGSASTNDVGTFTVNLAITEAGKVVQWDKIIAWNYVQFYVDTETIGNTYREGGSLTDNQRRIELSYNPLLFVPGPTPSIYSHITTWSFKNYDTGGGHTIIGYFKWKYIETA